jgi:hypothetical protein
MAIAYYMAMSEQEESFIEASLICVRPNKKLVKIHKEFVKLNYLNFLVLN